MQAILPAPNTPLADPTRAERRWSAIDLDAESAWWRGLDLAGFSIGGVRIPNRWLLAPMCEVTNLPYRLLARGLGAGLVCTEMISSVALARAPARLFESPVEIQEPTLPPRRRRGSIQTLRMLEFLPCEQPLMVQISGTDPQTMLEAALRVQASGAAILNLNSGCPVKKVVRGGSGSALLKDPLVLRRILRTLLPGLSIPVTVKMRAGWDTGSVNAVDVARMCADEGAGAVFIHGRTRSQMYEGRADRGLIERVKQAVRIPVIGNGDIFTAASALEMIEQTGCDAVLIGRGAIGNPWIFRDCVRFEAGLPELAPSLAERRAVIARHLELYVDYAEPARAVVRFRRQLMAYVKGLPGAPGFRARVCTLPTREAVLAELDRFFEAISPGLPRTSAHGR